jgi:membrane protein YdbS with pleckstrin-like domain
MRRHEARARVEAQARAFRALAVLRACCVAIACLCATFVLQGLLRGIGVPPAWLVCSVALLAVARLAPDWPWIAVGVAALLAVAQVLALLAMPAVPDAQTRAMAEVLHELDVDTAPLFRPRWVVLLPRVGIVLLGAVALSFMIDAKRDVSGANWDQLLAGHPGRKHTHLLLVAAAVLLGAASLLGVWLDYRIERRAEEAAMRSKEHSMSAVKPCDTASATWQKRRPSGSPRGRRGSTSGGATGSPGALRRAP